MMKGRERGGGRKREKQASYGCVSKMHLQQMSGGLLRTRNQLPAPQHYASPLFKPLGGAYTVSILFLVL